MTKIPAPGADLATDPIEKAWQLGLHADHRGYAELRAALAASEPVATVVGCVRDALGNTTLRIGWLRPEQCKVGTMLYAAAPAPVSGMPDLARRLNELDRHLAKCRFTERHAARQLVYSMLHEVCGIPSPQAPDTSTLMGKVKPARMADLCARCDESGECSPINGSTCDAPIPVRADQQRHISGTVPLPAAPAPTEQAGELPPLPRPLCTYVDHSYPAFNKMQMADYARAALASRQAPTEAPKEPNFDGFDFCAIQNAIRNLEYIEAGSYPSKDHDLDGGFVVANIGHAKKLARAVLPRLKAAEIALNRARQAPDSRDAAIQQAVAAVSRFEELSVWAEFPHTLHESLNDVFKAVAAIAQEKA